VYTDSTLVVNVPNCFGPKSKCGIQYPSGKKGHYPLAYAADWKHANYPTIVTCQDGGWGSSDDCSSPRTTARFDLSPSKNIGSRSYPSSAACSPTERPDHPLYGSGNLECFWYSSYQFKGWFTVAPGGLASEGYSTILYDNFSF
jgi:hypothetical protein